MVEANGVTLNVVRLPPRQAAAERPAPVVVFLHGAFIDSLASFYFTLGPAFAARGCEAVMYDMRGHGRSERPRSGYTVQDFGADLRALLRRLGVTRPVHLVGNSFGGTVALDHALRWPGSTASVLVIESGPATEQWAATMRAALRDTTGGGLDAGSLSRFVELYGTVSSTRSGPRHEARIERLGRSAGRLIGSTTIVQDITAGRPVTEEEIRAVDCPVLLVNGSRGLVGPQSAWLASVLPRARIAEVAGMKHSVLVEAPDAVGRLALDWVGEHAGAGGAVRGEGR
ncbi:alpha/beta hydrolase [Streptomyces sp. MP131-18]|uniref:alpha/beta fold hydrolase n=1 Tax=Streptomyces sp. MP131-18 TaxID=1857892 RepID=UPI0009D42497|nr:alpha/beta hydrolase [Streptomyces sp. MP131-18]ONK14107.1 Non-heme chloroperoxidase [Streptomyces sp. MP131-18]